MKHFFSRVNDRNERLKTISKINQIDREDRVVSSMCLLFDKKEERRKKKDDNHRDNHRATRSRIIKENQKSWYNPFVVFRSKMNTFTFGSQQRTERRKLISSQILDINLVSKGREIF